MDYIPEALPCCRSSRQYTSTRVSLSDLLLHEQTIFYYLLWQVAASVKYASNFLLPFSHAVLCYRLPPRCFPLL